MILQRLHREQNGTVRYRITSNKQFHGIPAGVTEFQQTRQGELLDSQGNPVEWGTMTRRAIIERISYIWS
jgi:hypothetical protein